MEWWSLTEYLSPTRFGNISLRLLQKLIEASRRREASFVWCLRLPARNCLTHPITAGDPWNHKLKFVPLVLSPYHPQRAAEDCAHLRHPESGRNSEIGKTVRQQDQHRDHDWMMNSND